MIVCELHRAHDNLGERADKNRGVRAMKKLTVAAMLVLVCLMVLCRSGETFASSYVVKGGAIFQVEANGSENKLENAKAVEVEEKTEENAIRFWSVLGKDISDLIEKEETGIYFFDKKGRNIAILPLESAYECQGLVFSPTGNRLAVMKGSGVRQDIEIVLYDAPEMKELESFGSIKDQFAWLDARRCVFTSIGEEIRDGSFANLGYGLRLSVVLYDAAARKATILREATDTQNFMLSAVCFETFEVEIIENSVKSDEDWRDEAKIKKKKISVPIPDAD
jgi:hypothetical protein